MPAFIAPLPRARTACPSGFAEAACRFLFSAYGRVARLNRARFLPLFRRQLGSNMPWLPTKAFARVQLGRFSLAEGFYRAEGATHAVKAEAGVFGSAGWQRRFRLDDGSATLGSPLPNRHARARGWDRIARPGRQGVVSCRGLSLEYLGAVLSLCRLTDVWRYSSASIPNA